MLLILAKILGILRIFDKMEIQELIYQLLFDDFIDVKDFFHIDDCLKNNGLTDDEIVAIVKSNNNELEINLNEEPLEIISKKKH
ncbi:18021_t:CDS:2 [Funneliformis geosporum]|nr:18021_t:CDS:2 [Funneliformis geosporum]